MNVAVMFELSCLTWPKGTSYKLTKHALVRQLSYVRKERAASA